MKQSVLHMTKDLLWILTSITWGLVSIGCNITPNSASTRTYKIPDSPTDSSYQVFVETPAGDLQSLSYNVINENFDTLSVAEGGLKPDYLPYPLNACFFAARQNDSLVKIPAWLLSARLEPGATLSVKIIGMIDYREAGISHQEFLVIPEDRAKQTVQTDRFRDFMIAYDPVKFMFETWLKNRHGIGTVSQINWQDEEKARQFLDKRLN